MALFSIKYFKYVFKIVDISQYNMKLYSQLQTTTGAVYGEMMGDSRISLADGTFIFVHKLASQLIDCGVKANFEELKEMFLCQRVR